MRVCVYACVCVCASVRVCVRALFNINPEMRGRERGVYRLKQDRILCTYLIRFIVKLKLNMHALKFLALLNKLKLSKHAPVTFEQC